MTVKSLCSVRVINVATPPTTPKKANVNFKDHFGSQEYTLVYFWIFEPSCTPEQYK